MYCSLLIAGYAVFAVALLATGSGLLDAGGRPIGTDFANIWSSGRLVLEGRPEVAFDPVAQRAYQMALFGQKPAYFYGWHYPPMFLAVAGVLATLPYLAALAAWLAATGWLYVRTIQRILPLGGDSGRLVVLAALAYPAMFANLTHGHNGALSATLLGLGLLLVPTRPVAAGICLGLLAYKPQYGLLLPFALLAAGYWRTVVAAAVTVAATTAASAVVFGVASWQAFFTHASFTKETILENGAAGWFKLQGLFPAVRMYGGSIGLAYAAQALAVVALLGAVIWLWRSGARHEQKCAGLVFATMLATPYAFNYDTVILGPAIAFLVADGMRHGFARDQISLLALVWATPLVSRDLTAFAPFPYATAVNAAALLFVLVAVRTAARDTNARSSHVLRRSPAAA